MINHDRLKKLLDETVAEIEKPGYFDRIKHRATEKSQTDFKNLSKNKTNAPENDTELNELFEKEEDSQK